MRAVNVRRGAVGAILAGVFLVAVGPSAAADDGPWTVTDLNGVPWVVTTPSASAGERSAPRRPRVSRYGARQVAPCPRLESSPAGRLWHVEPGDTLSRVERCTGVRVSVLADVNALADPDLILAGARLVIPE